MQSYGSDSKLPRQPPSPGVAGRHGRHSPCPPAQRLCHRRGPERPVPADRALAWGKVILGEGTASVDSCSPRAWAVRGDRGRKGLRFPAHQRCLWFVVVTRPIRAMFPVPRMARPVLNCSLTPGREPLSRVHAPHLPLAQVGKGSLPALKLPSMAHSWRAIRGQRSGLRLILPSGSWWGLRARPAGEPRRQPHTLTHFTETLCKTSSQS